MKTVNVSDNPYDFDFGWLHAIQEAPCLMTRAERLMLWSLVFSLRPESYLEIGTAYGGSALIVSSALDALQSQARMVLVDSEQNIDGETWEKIAHRAEFVEGHSPGIVASAVEGRGPFDLVLVDGCHTYTAVMADAREVLKHVGPGSYIVFHDAFYPDVARAIDDTVKQNHKRLHDLGVLTREMTIDADGNHWGGLRAVAIK